MDSTSNLHLPLPYVLLRFQSGVSAPAPHPCRYIDEVAIGGTPLETASWHAFTKRWSTAAGPETQRLRLRIALATQHGSTGSPINPAPGELCCLRTGFFSSTCLKNNS
jgi:hypothetical protein